MNLYLCYNYRDQLGYLYLSNGLLKTIFGIIVIDLVFFCCYYFNRIFNVGKSMTVKLKNIIELKSKKYDDLASEFSSDINSSKAHIIPSVEVLDK